jgi:2,4-dienoyl-CoA reductase-like NADH-dependent reductase (Old Yellow Enzyme family)/NADPH-dependent 2,4-dienoyl-CoA reductase/sulfur reductase-like enzyme
MPNDKYPLLFSPICIKNTVFRNRIMATPTGLAWADAFTGEPNDNTLFHYEDKARGGAATVTLSETAVSRDHGAPRGVGHYLVGDPANFGHPGQQLTKITEALWRHGTVPSIQLGHAGNMTWPIFIGGQDPWGPSEWTRPDGVHIREMDEGTMYKIAEDFATAAAAAKAYGFGMVMIHGAHSWLLGQFQSPATNWRKDKYGGSMENRARFPLMVCKAIRDKVGNDFLVEYRMSADEHIEGGIVLEEAVEFAVMIQDYVDIIHVSGGSYHASRAYVFSGPYQTKDFHTDHAAAIKKKVKVAVTTVGAHMDPDIMEQILQEGKADFIGVGRGFVADPEWIHKLEDDHRDDWRPCIRCNNCLGRKYNGINNCDVNPTAGAEMWTLRTPAVQTKRKVLVIGGGPGGMQAAITAAERGHQVILAEKTDDLGGTLKFSYKDRHKADLANYTNYLKRQVAKHAIDIRLNTEVTPRYIEKEHPYAVICAVGAEPIVPKFKGMGALPCILAVDAYNNPSLVKGKEIVVIGGGLVGCEVGIFLAVQGKKVTVVELQDDYAIDANIIHRSSMQEAIRELGDQYAILTDTRCEEITSQGVKVTRQGKEELLSATDVVTAIGMRAKQELVIELQKVHGIKRFIAIGDCQKPTRVKNAIHGGYYAAMDII